MSKQHDTGIEWAGQRWTVVHGCTPCSPGCDYCYAEAVAKQRLAGRCGYPPAPHHFDVVCREDRLLQPLHATKPADWFCTPMGDLFHEQVPDEFIDRVFAVMAACPQHTFKVLTKRPQRMRAYLNRLTEMSQHDRGEIVWRETLRLVLWVDGDRQYEYFHDGLPWPLPNVALGVTACTQAEADRNVPLLLATPAALRFVSLEPLLEEVRLDRLGVARAGAALNAFALDYYALDSGEVIAGPPGNWGPLDWVIAGCESLGQRPGRPAPLDWFRSLRDQCAAAGVPFLLKQFADPATGKLLKHCPPLDGVRHAAFPPGWEAEKNGEEQKC